MVAEPTGRIEELFHEALEKRPDERESFIEQSCAGDRALAAEVQSLVEAHEQGSEEGFLRTGSKIASSARSASGSRIGPYQLASEIAAGGMGTVYLAHRADGAYDKQVAFKLIKPDLALGAPSRAGELVRRFHEERQYLANLDHPHIAKLLDGGTADDGSPYLVMEYVEGVPIDRYCARHGLSTAERLRLFRTVCLAVQFVHSKLIAHRDLKPSNILVLPPSQPDGEPVPKLLDFGIAKILDPKSRDALLTTTAGLQRLTPAYASPEQFRREAVTTATDVYSLGVILYELLVGRLPYDLEGTLPHDVARIIGEQAPVRPSAIESTLRGDMETILLKALEKEPSRRYQSAAALADDIDRHLTGYPIRARPSSAAYRLLKTAARNPLAFGLAGAFLAAVTLLGIWILVLYQRAVHSEVFAEDRRRAAESARSEAERHAEEAEANATLLQDIFASPDPYERFGKEVKVVQVLEDAVRRLGEATVQPLTKAALQATLGWTYSSLGQFEQAEPLLEQALSAREDLLGEEHEDTIASRNDLAMLRHNRNRLEEAETLHRKNLEIERRVGGLDVRLATTLNNLASLLQFQGDLQGAEPLFREALEIRRRVNGDDHPETILLEQNLVLFLVHCRRLEEAEPLARKVLEARRSARSPDPTSIAEATRLLGQVLSEAGRLDEAEPLLRSALDDLRLWFGNEHTWVQSTMVELGSLLRALGRLEESESLFVQSLELGRRLRGGDDLRTLTAATHLSALYKSLGRFDEAEVLYREIVEGMQRGMGPENPNTLIAMINLASFLESQGNLTEAEEWFAKASSLAETGLHSGDPLKSHVQTVYGALLLKARRFEEAEERLVHGYTSSRTNLGESDPETLRALNLLVALYSDWDQPDQAAHFRALLESSRESAEDL